MNKKPFISMLSAGTEIDLNKEVSLIVEYDPSSEGKSCHRIDINFKNNGSIFQFDTDRCYKKLIRYLNQGEEAAKRNLVRYFENLLSKMSIN